MKIGIIGAGNIGGTLTRRLRALGHEVLVANSRGPETLRELAKETGAIAVTAKEAARAGEVVIVTIPEGHIHELPKDLFAGVPDNVVVVDTGNYYPRHRDGPDCRDRSGFDRESLGRKTAGENRRQGVQQHLRQAPAREMPPGRHSGSHCFARCG